MTEEPDISDDATVRASGADDAAVRAAGAPVAPGAGPEGAAGAAGTSPARRWPRLPVTTARTHWLLSALLAAGLVLRVLTQLAYQPALIYVDSLRYLEGAYPGSEPQGYTVLLKFILVFGDLGTVTALQHLLGLAMALLLYALLLRRGVPRWLGALAAAPLLLDAYQLQIEQMIMPDVWFEALILAGLAVLLWQPEVTMRRAVGAGVILAVAATVKVLGELLVLPAVVFLLAAGGRHRRIALQKSAALAVAFLAVIGLYCCLSYVRNGHFRLANSQPLTGRLVAAADCATLNVPPNVKKLCPTPAEQQALGPDALEHAAGRSPLYTVTEPLHIRGRLIAELKSAIENQQPARVAGSILGDTLRIFAWSRQPSPWVTPISRWQFQTGYPTYPPWTSVCPPGHLSASACMTGQHNLAKTKAPVTGMLIRPDGSIVAGVQRVAFGKFTAMTLPSSDGGPARVNRSLASFLRSYQLGGGYTPGPLLALLTLTAAAGSLLVFARRRIHQHPAAGQLVLACLLFTVTALTVLVAPDLYEFSWRYELPTVVTLVPAGVLGAAALWPRRYRYPHARQELFSGAGPGPDPGGDPPDQGDPERAPVV